MQDTELDVKLSLLEKNNEDETVENGYARGDFLCAVLSPFLSLFPSSDRLT